jgi:hypothetical protein
MKSNGMSADEQILNADFVETFEEVAEIVA